MREGGGGEVGGEEALRAVHALDRSHVEIGRAPEEGLCQRVVRDELAPGTSAEAEQALHRGDGVVANEAVLLRRRAAATAAAAAAARASSSSSIPATRVAAAAQPPT